MNNRKSNMELLRIVAMFMIIAYHIFYHCISIQLTDLSIINESADRLFMEPGFIKRMIILAVVAPMGQIGNAIFILISGFFMVRKGSEVDLTKISGKLLKQLAFASLVLGGQFYYIKLFREYRLI